MTGHKNTRGDSARGGVPKDHSKTPAPRCGSIGPSITTRFSLVETRLELFVTDPMSFPAPQGDDMKLTPCALCIWGLTAWLNRCHILVGERFRTWCWGLTPSAKVTLFQSFSRSWGLTDASSPPPSPFGGL